MNKKIKIENNLIKKSIKKTQQLSCVYFVRIFDFYFFIAKNFYFLVPNAGFAPA